MKILYLLLVIVVTASHASEMNELVSKKIYQSGLSSNQTNNNMSSINVELKLPQKVHRGSYITAILAVTNKSDSKIEVSSRLNLSEGDVRLLVNSPTGHRVTANGVMVVDTPSKMVILEPDQSIESGLFISFTDAGLLFRNPGRYRVQAEYDPGGDSQIVLSEEVVLHVMDASTSRNPALIELVENERAVKEIATGGAYGDEVGRKKLGELAEKLPDQKEGVIAQIVLIAGDPEATEDEIVSALAPRFRNHEPIALAEWCTAVISPLSPSGETLKKVILEILEDSQFSATNISETDHARKILLQQPLEN